MQQTNQYHFHLIEHSDPVQTAPLNENMERVEQALIDLHGLMPRIAAGTYVGDGTGGSRAPCTLNVGFAPKLVMVYREDLGLVSGVHGEVTASRSDLILAPCGAKTGKRIAAMDQGGDFEVTDHFVWGEDSFSWYTDTNYSGYVAGAKGQLNAQGVVYHYFVLG